MIGPGGVLAPEAGTPDADDIDRGGAGSTEADEGIVGMRVGGRRKLVVPSKLGYGKKGSAPEIPPNATLLFDVTLERIL